MPTHETSDGTTESGNDDAADLGSDYQDPAYNAEFPLWLLVRAYHVVAREYRAVFATVNLSPAQFGVLAELADNPSVTQAELARRALIRPQSLGQLVAPLLAQGLLHRDGPGGRGRPAPLTLSDEGRRRIAQVLPLVRRFDDLTRYGLSSDQIATFTHVLTVLSGEDTDPGDRPGGGGR